MDKGILNKIRALNPTKSQKKIADFIIGNEKHAAYMTAAKLASSVGVSEATVVRFAVSLGYDGYPEFQKALKTGTKKQLTATERMEIASEKISEKDIAKTVLKSDIEKLEKTIHELDYDNFNKATELILNAEHIYIAGVRSSAALASFAGFYLKLLFENTTVITGTGAEDITEQLFHAGRGDVVLGISFPRYSSGTVKALSFAERRGADIIALTDSIESPIVKHSSCTLLARSEMDSFADSLVAPMSILNALIFAVGYRMGSKTKETFDELENIWRDYEVYDSE